MTKELRAVPTQLTTPGSPSGGVDNPPITPGSVVADQLTGNLWGLSRAGYWQDIDGFSEDGWGADQLWCFGGSHTNACQDGHGHNGFSVVFDAGSRDA